MTPRAVASPRPVWVAVLVSALGVIGLTGCSRQPPGQVAGHAAAATHPQPPPVTRRLYGQTVVVPSGASAALQRVGGELVENLSKATGVPFELKPNAAHGIMLLRADAPEVPAELAAKLQGESREAYVISSKGNGTLLIVANGDDGLSFGAYQYLESLGVRFYFPHPRWTIVPSLRDVERDQERLVRPAFRLRQFAGTGGLGKALVVDPKGELAARWDIWKRQNGFGEQFHLDGHSGEGFNTRNKAELLAHPEYLASLGGKRVAWSKIAKLDPTNPKAVELFVQDRLQTYREKLLHDPDGPGSFGVSVEPADGGGHCDSPDCEELGSVSDQEFFVANQVARALSKEHPGARASLFAYNLHADVPKIDIEPNVYVTLVPYAFQRNGVDPEAFIRTWVKKKSPLSVYDYWSIPDWVADQPLFDYRNTPAKKLRFWHEQGIEGFLGESTYSAGAMGLGWYVAGHLMWNPEADANALADGFFHDAFARAEPPMRRMLERWASGFYLNSMELRASFMDLSEAFKLSPSPAVTARLVDYAGYLQYLRLRLAWQLAGKADVTEKKRALVEHLWRVYDSAMLDTFRLQQLLVRKDAVLNQELDPTRAELAFWQTLRPATEADARSWLSAGLRDFPSLGCERKSYSGELVPVASASVALASGAAPNLTLVGSNRLELTVPPGLTSFGVVLRVGSSLTVQLLDATRAAIASEQLASSDAPQTFNATVPAPGTYLLDLRTAKIAQTTLTFPTELGVELTDLRTPKAVPVPDFYFYVPAGLPAVALIDPIALPPKSGAFLLDASGQPVPLERLDGGRLIIARVPPNQSGKIWTLRRGVAPDFSLVLLNAPQRLALSPQALRVPAGALAAKPY